MKKSGKDGYHYAELALVLLDTGLRLTEGLTLEVRDIGETRLTVRAENSKNGKARTVPLSKDAKAVLERRMVVEGSAPTDKPFRGMTKWSALKRMSAAKEALELGHTDLGWHTLRHTCATRLLSAGANLMTVKTWLGHHDIKTTQRYLHYVEGAMEEALTLRTEAYTRSLDVGA